MRGISVEEIAEATKIGSRSLRALEEEHFDRLPGGIFNRGFVRAYARYLGIDEEQAVTDYLGAELAYQQAHGTPLTMEVRLTPRQPREGQASWWPALLALVLLVVGFSGWRWYNARQARQAEHAAAVKAAAAVRAQAAPATPKVPAANPAASANPATGTSPAASSGEGFVVQVRAKERSWIWLSTDDGAPQEVTLEAAGEKTMRAAKRLVLKVGNLPGVEISFNGQPVAVTGGDKVKSLVFTEKGLEP